LPYQRLLIISYHALPLDVVASYRTKGYCDYLFENEVFPTLVTHIWEKDENMQWRNHEKNDEVRYKSTETHNVIMLPRPTEKIGLQSVFKTIMHWAAGDLETHLKESKEIFKNFLFSHLKENQYDGVLAIFSPHFHLKLAFEINKEFGIPYVLDFRDLWDNQVVTQSYSPSFKKKVQDAIIKYHWRKWLRNSLFFVTTSTKWTIYLEGLSNKKGFIIPNGHELFEIGKSKNQEEFKLTYFGRIYSDQNLNLILEGIGEFLKKVKPKKFKLLLIGIKQTEEFDGLQYVLSQIESEYVQIIDYLPKQELMDLCRNEATMFFLPSFYEDNGQFMVKLYDFVALGKPTIISPAVDSDMEVLVNETNAGIILNSANSVASYLEKQYNYFLNHGQANNDFDTVKVLDYHRQNHVKSFSDLWKNNL
jgi:glycosyltransferase involved in cell wall biosynthesis